MLREISWGEPEVTEDRNAGTFSVKYAADGERFRIKGTVSVSVDGEKMDLRIEYFGGQIQTPGGKSCGFVDRKPVSVAGWDGVGVRGWFRGHVQRFVEECTRSLHAGSGD